MVQSILQGARKESYVVVLRFLVALAVELQYNCQEPMSISKLGFGSNSSPVAGISPRATVFLIFPLSLIQSPELFLATDPKNTGLSKKLLPYAPYVTFSPA